MNLLDEFIYGSYEQFTNIRLFVNDELYYWIEQNSSIKWGFSAGFKNSRTYEWEATQKLKNWMMI